MPDTSTHPTHPAPSRAAQELVLNLGERVRLADGGTARLEAAVVDPDARTLVDVVLLPPRGHRTTRLVPWRSLRRGSDGDLHCGFTVGRLCALPAVAQVMWGDGWDHPHPDDEWDVGTCRAHEAGLSAPDLGWWTEPHEVMTVWDRVPRGTVELRRGTRVHAGEARYGEAEVDPVVARLHGFVVATDGRVLDLLVHPAHHLRAHDRAVPAEQVLQITTAQLRLRPSWADGGTAA